MNSSLSRDRACPAFVLMAFLLTFTVACASSSGGDKATSTATDAPSARSTQKAGVVTTLGNVTVDASALQGDRLESYLRHGGSNVLAEAVESAIAENGSTAGDVTVNVTEFRLRSTGSALWLGAMAGADTIRCEVVTSKAGGGTNRFQTDTSTIMGGFIMPGSKTRFNRMVRELGKRIAAGL